VDHTDRSRSSSSVAAEGGRRHFPPDSATPFRWNVPTGYAVHRQSSCGRPDLTSSSGRASTGSPRRPAPLAATALTEDMRLGWQGERRRRREQSRWPRARSMRTEARRVEASGVHARPPAFPGTPPRGSQDLDALPRRGSRRRERRLEHPPPRPFEARGVGEREPRLMLGTVGRQARLYFPCGSTGGTHQRPAAERERTRQSAAREAPSGRCSVAWAWRGTGLALRLSDDWSDARGQ
jgi:hypothetical protein